MRFRRRAGWGSRRACPAYSHGPCAITWRGGAWHTARLADVCLSGPVAMQVPGAAGPVCASNAGVCRWVGERTWPPRRRRRLLHRVHLCCAVGALAGQEGAQRVPGHPLDVVPVVLQPLLCGRVCVGGGGRPQAAAGGGDTRRGACRERARVGVLWRPPPKCGGEGRDTASALRHTIASTPAKRMSAMRGGPLQLQLSLHACSRSRRGGALLGPAANPPQAPLAGPGGGAAPDDPTPTACL